MVLRAEDMGDKFWSITDREQQEVSELHQSIMEIQVQIDLIRKVEALRNAPGFQDFLNTVKGLHRLVLDRLVGDDSLTDPGLREQRGQAKALESVLALMTKPTINDTLARQLQERKNLLAEALKRRPKPKTEETKVTP